MKLLSGLLLLNVFKDRRKLELNRKLYHAIDTCNLSIPETCSFECLECENGTIICESCKGTGFLMINNDLIGTNNNCSICRGLGEIKCKECAGTGFFANWLK